MCVFVTSSSGLNLLVKDWLKYSQDHPEDEPTGNTWWVLSNYNLIYSIYIYITLIFLVYDVHSYIYIYGPIEQTHLGQLSSHPWDDTAR